MDNLSTIKESVELLALFLATAGISSYALVICGDYLERYAGVKSQAAGMQGISAMIPGRLEKLYLAARASVILLSVAAFLSGALLGLHYLSFPFLGSIFIIAFCFLVFVAVTTPLILLANITLKTFDQEL